MGAMRRKPPRNQRKCTASALCATVDARVHGVWGDWENVPGRCQEQREKLPRLLVCEVSLEREQMGRWPKKAGSVMGCKRRRKRITPNR